MTNKNDGKKQAIKREEKAVKQDGAKAYERKPFSLLKVEEKGKKK